MHVLNHVHVELEKSSNVSKYLEFELLSPRTLLNMRRQRCPLFALSARMILQAGFDSCS